ncbi:ribonuclease H-like domain-containing protein [Tanacetum coccineum]
MQMLYRGVGRWSEAKNEFEIDVRRSNLDNTTRLSDATIYAFLANQPNGSQVVHEDLEQIHEDDLEEMDLKWQLALLSMKARKFYQRTGKKIIINGSDTAGYDKTKVECFNCHKMGHFARECRNPRSQENRSRNQDSSRRTVNVEESSSKAMLAIDGAGVDWSFMTEEEVPTNFALMAFSDLEVHNNKACSKTCLKSFKDLKSQYDNLRIELNKSKSDLANYKRGLASVEEQLVFYKKNKGMLCDQIAVFKRDASFNESEINALKIQIERLKKEKESNQVKIDNFENAFKSLDKLIGSQISDNNRKGVGYNAVAPPPTGLFAPPPTVLTEDDINQHCYTKTRRTKPHTRSESLPQGNAIQANMDVNNIEHFNPMLKLGVAYKISRTRAIIPKSSLRISIIQSAGVKNSLPRRKFKDGLSSPKRLGCIRSISDIFLFENAKRSQSFRRKVDNENLESVKLQI